MSNAILIAMLDSDTITMDSTIAEVQQALAKQQTFEKIEIVTAKKIEESAEDILMFGC